MRKLLIKTFVMAVVAFACITMASCSKSAEELSNDAKELVKDGKIAPENVDKALNVYDAVIEKIVSLQEETEDSAKNFEFDSPVFAELKLLKEAGDLLEDGLAAAQLTAEQQARQQEISEKIKDAMDYKTPEELNTEAKELVKDGKIAQEQISKAIKLYKAVAYKLVRMQESVDTARANADLENQVFKDQQVVNEARNLLEAAFAAAQLKEDDQKRVDKIAASIAYIAK